MAIHTVSATELSRSLSVILNKVHYQGESYEIKRGKENIARIIPASPKKSTLKVSDLNSLFARFPHLDKEEHALFESDLQHIRDQMILEDKSWD